MFQFKRVTEVAVIAVLLTGLGGAALAQGDVIAARVGFMRSIGGSLKAASTATDMAVAKAEAQKLSDGFKAFPSQFPVGSDAAMGKTRAKAEIWTDAAGFKAANDKAVAATDALLAATGGMDLAAVTAAVTAVQGTCGGCHSVYRGPPVA